MNDLQLVYLKGVAPFKGVLSDQTRLRLFANAKPLSMGFDRAFIAAGFDGSTLDAVKAFQGASQLVIVEPGDSIRERGMTHSINEPGFEKTSSPVVTLSSKGIRAFGPLADAMSAWVLEHEFGHVQGLVHHPNPFCIMCPVNVSFGRFCASCTQKLYDTMVAGSVM